MKRNVLRMIIIIFVMLLSVFIIMGMRCFFWRVVSGREMMVFFGKFWILMVIVVMRFFLRL